MASTYTINSGVEKITNGEQAGTWGTTTNNNLDIIDRAINGVGAVPLSGTTHDLTTTDGTLSEGGYKVLVFTGALGANNTVTIEPNDQAKLYLAVNSTTDSGSSGPYNVIVSQGTGANATILNGEKSWIYADGGGSDAIVAKVSTDILNDTSPQLGGNLDTNGKLIKFGDAAEAGTDDTLEFGASDDMQLYHDATNSYITNKTGALKIATETSGIAVTIGHTTSETTIADNATVVGNITLGANIVAASDVTLDCGGDITLDADGSQVRFKDAGTERFTFNLDATPELDVTGGTFTIHNTTSDADVVITGNDGGSAITALTIDMSAAGAATFNNDVTAFSDRRLKTDIEPITNALPKVMQMQGVYYKRNDVEDAREQIGVIAQDMEAIVPEVVLTADDDMQTKSVDYGKLCAVLIESIKELKAEIDELKKN